MKRPSTHVLKWPFGAFEILCSFQEKDTEHMLSDLICRTDNHSVPVIVYAFLYYKMERCKF